MSQELAPLPADVEPIGRATHHTDDEVDAGLAALAVLGSSEAASSHLAATGVEIPARTLRDWRKAYPKRLAALGERYRGPTEQVIKNRLREVILRGTAAQLDGIDLTHQQIEAGTIKDPSGAQRNLGVSVGIATQRLNELEGRPIRHEHTHMDFADIRAELKQRVPSLFVDSTAEDLDPAPLSPQTAETKAPE